MLAVDFFTVETISLQRTSFCKSPASPPTRTGQLDTIHCLACGGAMASVLQRAGSADQHRSLSKRPANLVDGTAVTDCLCTPSPITII
jgi:hypothetical protein